MSWTALPPPPDIVRSAYAELTVTDLPRAHWFWVEVLGFVVTKADPGALYLRGYDELTHHNLILREGPQPANGLLAFRVRTPADLDRAVEFYRHLDCRTVRLPAGTTPGIGEAVRAEDPLGFTVEFFHDATLADRLQQRYDLRRGAEAARIDHFNIVVADVQEAYEYYTSLGFGLSETIEDRQTLYAAWMYRKQTVHDMAFTGGAGPRLHHLGFYAHEAHHVLRTCDILGSLHEESHIERGPGRHGVSNAFYVYLRDPDGHRPAPSRLLWSCRHPLVVRRGDDGTGSRREPAADSRDPAGRGGSGRCGRFPGPIAARPEGSADRCCSGRRNSLRTSRRCRSLVISIRSGHSRRALAIQRSATAFAQGAAAARCRRGRSPPCR
jgi:catechol 2,3-dioxygenase